MTKAQDLYAKFGINPTATVTINGTEFTFKHDSAFYDAFLNEFSDRNKLTPARDYLLAIVAPEQRAELTEYLTLSSLALELFGVVDKAFKPNIEIKLKN